MHLVRPASLELVWQCVAAEARLFAASAATSRLFERSGLIASIAPSAPDRSMFNWIVPCAAGSLERWYDEVARAYRDSGVRAFTVWVDADDARTKTFLAER